MKCKTCKSLAVDRPALTLAEVAAQLGRVKSPAKSAAARANGAKGGRPKRQAKK